MRDTPIDVEPETFDAASKVVGQNMAGQLTDAVARLEDGLSATAAMAGSDPGGMKWASAYDQAASVIAGAVTDLANACCKIAEMLEQTGLNHGAADDASDPRRTVPTGPDTTTYYPRPTVTPTPPPSARGGTGAPPDGWGLIQQAVGYVWPNGDPGKLRAAAQAWSAAASTVDGANRSFPEAIEAIRSQQSPEVDDAATVCQTLSQHIEDTAASCRDLATACTDYANQLDKAHQDVANELADLVASTAVIEGAGVVFTEVAGELWAQGIEAGRVAATAARVGEILAPLADMASAAADTITTIISKVAQVAQRLKVILGAQITRATAAVVERLPGLSKDVETTATERLESAQLTESQAAVDSRKFSDYIFKANADHGKDQVFRSLGYDRSDSEMLSQEYQKQAMDKFARGDYALGKLDQYGQRINIEIELHGIGDEAGKVSYLKSGWMIRPDGSITLNTPFSGFSR